MGRLLVTRSSLAIAALYAPIAVAAVYDALDVVRHAG